MPRLCNSADNKLSEVMQDSKPQTSITLLKEITENTQSEKECLPIHR
jgi:hypothetical protein